MSFKRIAVRMSNYEWREVLTEFLGDEGAIKTKKKVYSRACAGNFLCYVCLKNVNSLRYFFLYNLSSHLTYINIIFNNFTVIIFWLEFVPYCFDQNLSKSFISHDINFKIQQI